MQKAFGCILMAIGILVAGTFGLCLMILAPSHRNSSWDFYDALDILSSMPMLIGLAMIGGGFMILRSANKRDDL